MAMFRHFSFDSPPVSCSPNELEHDIIDRASMNASPTSTTTTPPPALALAQAGRLPTPPPCSLGELAQRFHRHSLRVEVSQPAQPVGCTEPLTPPSDDCVFPSLSPTCFRPVSVSACMSASSLRARRQANTRLQCSEAHIRDISLLVEKMVEERNQCSVRESKTSSMSDLIEPDEDEGIDMDYFSPSPQSSPQFTLKFRRSTDRPYGQASVIKNVRMRKKPTTLGKTAVSKRS